MAVTAVLPTTRPHAAAAAPRQARPQRTSMPFLPMNGRASSKPECVRNFFGVPEAQFSSRGARIIAQDHKRPKAEKKVVAVALCGTFGNDGFGRQSAWHLAEGNLPAGRPLPIHQPQRSTHE